MNFVVLFRSSARAFFCQIRRAGKTTFQKPIQCSHENCGKSRVVFAEIKPSDQEIKAFREKIKDSFYVCGDRVDILRKFACNERIHCSNHIEIVYYSGLADMAIEDVICYACGEKLSLELFGKYIEEKAINSQVFPTCGKDRCKKYNTKLFMHKPCRRERLTRHGRKKREWEKSSELWNSERKPHRILMIWISTWTRRNEVLVLSRLQRTSMLKSLHIEGRSFSRFTQVVWSSTHESHWKGYLVIYSV